MKLNEIMSEEHLSAEQLNEISAKQIIAAGALAAAALGLYTHSPSEKISPEHSGKVDYTTREAVKLEAEIDKLTALVTSKYKIKKDEAKAIVLLAKKYEKPVFPKAKDILAIIGIESSFNSTAVSSLKKDPAVGLMQVRPGVWGIAASSLRNDVNKQIEFGSDILHKYFNKLKDKSDAVRAYNIGLTNFRNGKQEDAQMRYLDKYNSEVKHFNDI